MPVERRLSEYSVVKEMEKFTIENLHDQASREGNTGSKFTLTLILDKMLVQKIKPAFHPLNEQKQNKQNHDIHSLPQQLKN